MPNLSSPWLAVWSAEDQCYHAAACYTCWEGGAPNKPARYIQQGAGPLAGACAAHVGVEYCAPASALVGAPATAGQNTTIAVLAKDGTIRDVAVRAGDGAAAIGASVIAAINNPDDPQRVFQLTTMKCNMCRAYMPGQPGIGGAAGSGERRR